MRGLKPREERLPVAIRARMRTECGWGDVVIANVSSRGLMLRTPEPPGGMTYIEVRYQTVVIVGRVVWTNGLQCGVLTQDRLDISALLSPVGGNAKRAANDRRTVRRPPDPPRQRPLAERADASRHFARLFDFAVIAVAAVSAAGFAASLVFDVVEAPMTRTANALAGASAPSR